MKNYLERKSFTQVLNIKKTLIYSLPHYLLNIIAERGTTKHLSVQ